MEASNLSEVILCKKHMFLVTLLLEPTQSVEFVIFGEVRSGQLQILQWGVWQPAEELGVFASAKVVSQTWDFCLTGLARRANLGSRAVLWWR